MDLDSLTSGPPDEASPSPDRLRISRAMGRTHPLFDALRPDEVGRLAALMTPQVAERGETIFSEDEPAEHLFVVGAGTVKLYKLLADGRRQVIGFLFPGDVLGLEANERHLCHAQAVTRAWLWRLPRRRLDAITIEIPHVVRGLLDVASHELAEAEEQMVLLGRRTARERVAAFLLRLAERAGGRGQPVDRIALPMTRGDIADYLGLSLETVSRTLSELRHDGLIGVPHRGRVDLLKPRALARVARGEGG